MRCRSYRILVLLVVGGLVLLPVVAQASEAGGGGGGDMTHRMTQLMLQLAVILCVAKIGGFLFGRFLRVPAVLGELCAGMLIGPYALGPVLGLFAAPLAGSGFPLSPELYGIATLASILLLYLAGLETDLSMFLQYSVAGTLVGIGGVVFSFGLGAASAVWFGLATSYMDPAALFLGTISTATSVGITARVLGERNKLDSAEGVTILAGAVIDDVLGIVILAIVVGMAKGAQDGGGISWGHIGRISAMAFGFWLVTTVVGLLLAPWIGKGLEKFGSRQTMAALSLGLALLLAGLAEKAGLAMIIGAYIMGLSLSRADCARELQHRLEPVYETLVSIFFCVMGMLVNVGAMKGVLLFGLLYSVLAIVAKVVGCGLPALAMRFNMLGAMRVGIGMLPRGEVALIVAGIGLTTGVVGEEVFGVAILMTLITTVIAPLVMVRIFDDRSGLRASAQTAELDLEPVTLTLPSSETAEFLQQRIVRMFEQEDCYVHRVAPDAPIYQVRKDDMHIIVRRESNTIYLACGEIEREFAKLVLLEAVAELITLLESLRNVGTTHQQLRAQVMA